MLKMRNNYVFSTGTLMSAIKILCRYAKVSQEVSQHARFYSSKGS